MGNPGWYVSFIALFSLVLYGLFSSDGISGNVVLPPETHNIVTVAGSVSDTGDGGPATAAQVNTPWDLAADSSGNLYIAEFGGNRVRKVDLVTGLITTFAGTGVAGSSGDGGLATAAQLNLPSGLAFDASGNLYIGDNNNNRVRKVNLATRIITTVAGTGVPGFSGDGGLATAAQLNLPSGLAFDASGNLYIAEFGGHRVRKVDLVTGIITTVAGIGVQGFDGDNIQATAARINTPRGLAFDSSGNLYFAEFQGRRVRKVDLAKGIITTVAGTGVAGYNGDNIPATTAQLNSPRGVAVDSGNLYIGDQSNNRVRKVDLVTGIITTVAGTGDPDFSGDGGPATEAQLNSPRGVAVDSLENLYISEENLYSESGGNRVRKVNLATGIITTFAGGSPIPLGDGGLATAAQLNSPRGVAVDSLENLYISDQSNNRVRKVDQATGIITTVAGIGTAGFSGDGGPATAAQLNGPSGLDSDSAGNLYIAELDNHRVRKVDQATGIITTVAGTGTVGFSGDGGPATAAQLNSPRGVAVDSAGNLYISDAANQRIRRVDAVTGIITTVAGIGVQGFDGDNIQATAARINTPRGLAFDSSGNLYFAEFQGRRVRKVDLVTGIITTVAGTGDAGSSGDGGPATAAQLNGPQGLTFDASGDLYIGDQNNGRVRKVDQATGIITTVAGIGTAGFSGDGGPATAAQLNGPSGLDSDSAGNLYIAELGNNRVRRLNVATSLNVDPDTLNITKSKGKWVTAYIQFPAGRDASDVNLSSVVLKAIDPTNGAVRHSISLQALQVERAPGSPAGLIDTNKDGVPDQLILKFDRATVASWATGAPELMLRVEGQLQIGTYFSGDT